jgi:hypothetical protein
MRHPQGLQLPPVFCTAAPDANATNWAVLCRSRFRGRLLCKLNFSMIALRCLSTVCSLIECKRAFFGTPSRPAHCPESLGFRFVSADAAGINDDASRRRRSNDQPSLLAAVGPSLKP